jgi:hypothetical protein
MIIDDLSEEKNSSDITNERRNLPELTNLTMRHVLQQNLLERMNVDVQQRNRGNQEVQQYHLLQQLQEDERQRQILTILQSRQAETELRQLQHLQQQQSGLSLPPIVDTASQVSLLTPAALLQLHLHQQRRNQQRIHEEELQRLQLQQLLLQQRDRRQHQHQVQLIQLERERASLLNVGGPNLSVAPYNIRSIISSLPMRGSLDAVGNTSTGMSMIEINRLEAAEFQSGTNDTSPRNINLSLPMRRNFNASSNVGVPEVSGIDVARVQAAIFQVDEENFAAAANDSGHETESEASDAMVLPPWSETSAQLMKKMQKSDGKADEIAAKKKSSLRKKIVGMVSVVVMSMQFSSIK